MKQTKESSNLRMKSKNIKVNLQEDANKIPEKRTHNAHPLFQVPEELKRLIKTNIWKKHVK